MLDPVHKTKAIAELHEIGPDTFDEGPFGGWTFTDLTRTGDDWALAFSNEAGEGTLQFTYAGDCVDASGNVQSGWLDAVQEHILNWSP